MAEKLFSELSLCRLLGTVQSIFSAGISDFFSSTIYYMGTRADYGSYFVTIYIQTEMTK